MKLFIYKDSDKINNITTSDRKKLEVYTDSDKFLNIEQYFFKVLNVEEGRIGRGLIPGGTTEQFLVKNSDNDYDTKWSDACDLTFDCVNFNTDYSETVPEGTLAWNSDAGTLNVGMPGGSLTLQVGQETLLKAKNDSGSLIENGSVVYISGSSGVNPRINLVDRTDITKSTITGVATQDIGNNKLGYITLTGVVRNLDLSDFEDGDRLWVGSTPGSLTNVEPNAPDVSVFVGIVANTSGDRKIIASPSITPLLNNLSDINGTPVDTSGQILVWDDNNKYFDLNYNINDYATTISTRKTAFKTHRSADLIPSSTEWFDVTFDTKIDGESLSGSSYYDEGLASEDKSIIVVKGFNNIFTISGCFHTIWNGPAGTSVKVASRILQSDDQGVTWNEKRCTQYLISNKFGDSAEGTGIYNGSALVNGETWFKLQLRVSDTRMYFQGDPWFDHPVAATLKLSNIGDNSEVTS